MTAKRLCSFTHSLSQPPVHAISYLVPPILLGHLTDSSTA